MRITERECTLLALQHKDTPWVPSQDTGQDVCYPTVIEEGARGYGITKDWFGVSYILREDQFGPMPAPGQIKIKDITEWRKYITFPDLDDYDWEGCAARDTVKWDRQNRVSNVILINGIFESMHLFSGIENALCNLLLEPEACSDFLSAMADYKIEIIRRVKKYYNPDKIQFHDDYSNNDNLFMSTDTWKKLIKPHLKRIIDETHECGMYYEHHCCGKIVDLVEELVELGIDALNPVQIQNNPVKLKEKFGSRLTLCGGFDNQGVLDRLDASEEDIRRSLLKTLQDMSKGGQWIARVSFLDKTREDIWLDVLYEWNKPLMERAGVKPVRYKAKHIDYYDLSKRTGTTKKSKYF
jgi:hypothetical protein